MAVTEFSWAQWLNPLNDGYLCIIGGYATQVIAGCWRDEGWQDISAAIIPPDEVMNEMARLAAWAEAPDPDPEILEALCKIQDSPSGRDPELSSGKASPSAA